jgi:hypothetical protein
VAANAVLDLVRLVFEAIDLRPPLSNGVEVSTRHRVDEREDLLRALHCGAHVILHRSDG